MPVRVGVGVLVGVEVGGSLVGVDVLVGVEVSGAPVVVGVIVIPPTV
jgi:hypothetical protein